MAITIFTPPLAPPVTVAEAKAYARIAYDDDDDVIEELIAAARDHIEQATGRVTVATTYLLTLDEFPPNELRLPRSPLRTVDSVHYDDAAGDEHTLASSAYTVDNKSEPPWLAPDGPWPATFAGINSVRVQFSAGYAPVGSPADHTANVPARAKVAIKALVAHWYNQREPVPVTPNFGEVPYHLTRLINGLRVWR
jgi:uncharacterized phiE125 gp8 family phage protein